MGHVVDKVILDLGQLLLAEDDIDRKYKGYQQNQRKDDGRYHKSDRTENVII